MGKDPFGKEFGAARGRRPGFIERGKSASRMFEPTSTAA
jgi:hypothetical protein